ncbi:MAG: cytochrome c [Nitrospirota bacterium]
MKILKLAILSVLIVWPVFACKMSTETGDIHSNVRTDPESIARGDKLFNLKCAFCHDLDGSGDRVGPGMAGILRQSKLPVSKRPATPENIKRQLLEPYERMPSFTYLSEEDIQDLIAFLNTL